MTLAFIFPQYILRNMNTSNKSMQHDDHNSYSNVHHLDSFPVNEYIHACFEPYERMGLLYMTLRNDQNDVVPVPEVFHVFSDALGGVKIEPRLDHVFRLLHSGSYTIFYNEALAATVGPDREGHWKIVLPAHRRPLYEDLHDSDSD
jgi:hypothetical protein